MKLPQVVVPDRYEGLARRAKEDIGSIVVPVPDAMLRIDEIFSRMNVAGRGAFLVLEGESGAGKSTFLHTLRFFKEGVTSLSVPGGASIRDFLGRHQPTGSEIEVFVLEEREAALSFTNRELEDWLHAINGFIRSEKGERSLVVWPANTEDLRDRIVSLARRIGAEALIGTDKSAYKFPGPERALFPEIAQRTLAVLNQSAGLSDLGLTAELLDQHVAVSDTVGSFLTRVHESIAAQERFVKTLVDKEQCRLWVIIVAGNDPDAVVAGLTRGRYSEIDTDRLLSSTGANIVTELRGQPEKVGLLGTVLNARILHLPVLAAAALARAFANDALRIRMRTLGLAITPKDESAALDRLNATELASIFRAGAQGTLSRGPKLGPASVEAFGKLVEIAQTNDALLNDALGRALKAARLIKSYKLEQDFGAGLNRRTDLLAETEDYPIRIEVMWRKKTGRADISNYVLTKLTNYGRAIGYLK